MDIGEVVPDFSLQDQDGIERRLSVLLRDGPVVLFFYPMAMTRGCTAESCSFRDLGAEFGAIGAQRVGISADSVARQKQFSELHSFDYPLLSDPEREVARIFGVRRIVPFLPNKRWTFVIDTDRRLIAVIKSELHMGEHADQALAALRAHAAS